VDCAYPCLGSNSGLNMYGKMDPVRKKDKRITRYEMRPGRFVRA